MYRLRWVLSSEDTPNYLSLMGLDLDFYILFPTFCSNQKYIPVLFTY